MLTGLLEYVPNPEKARALRVTMNKQSYTRGTIERIETAVDLGMKYYGMWFRGQPNTFDNLTPGIFRVKFDAMRLFPTERTFIEDFKRAAPAITPQTPRKHEHLDWLFLMQHHRLPTRLLDWTQSVLVALYFAVNDFQPKDGQGGKDGELWAMNPYELNHQSRMLRTLAPPFDPRVQWLAERVWNPQAKIELDDEMRRADYEYFENNPLPLAILPPMAFPRIVSQLSAFTIHTDDERGDYGIIATLGKLEFDSSPRPLYRYIIPNDCKPRLLQDLAGLGITRLTMFQDLDSLSQDIVDKWNFPSREPRVPPEGDQSLC